MHSVIVAAEIILILFAAYEVWRLVLLKETASMERLLMIVCGFASLVHNIGYLCELLCASLNEVLLSVRVEYVGGTFFLLSYVFFVYNYCKRTVPKVISYSLSSVCLLLILIVFTCQYHDLYYATKTFTDSGLYPHLTTTAGPFYYLFIIYTLTTGGIVIFVCISTLIREKHMPALRRKLIYQLMLAPTLPLIVMLLFSLKILRNVDLTPFVSLLATVYIIVLLQRNKLFDVVKSARDLVLEETDDALIIVDRQLNVLDANPAALRILPDLNHVHDQLLHGVPDESFFNIDQMEKQELQLGDRYYQSHVTGVPDSNGTVQGFATMLFDVTQTHEFIEELKSVTRESEKANRAKSDFLANISHEIRTPMNAIIGMSELIIEESVGRKVYDYAHDIKIASNNLLSIINDILDVSKIEAGKLELVPTNYYTKLLFEEIIHVFTVSASAKCLKFITEIDDSLPYELYGDNVRIRQILMNLLSNAIKFTRQGHVKLKVTGEYLSASEILLHMEVSDTGIGIEEDNLEKIFANFQQVDTQKNREIQGTGLGLSITKNLVSLMNGEIQVTSEYGKGSVFTALIHQKVLDKRKLSDITVRKQQSDETEHKSFISPSTKVLLVDDNKINLKVAQALLETYQLQIDLATNGMDAIESVKNNHYDIIFMDHMMPIMDGVETVSHIRTECGDEGKNVVIIALTANAFKESQEMFLHNGFQDFIPKPIEPTVLAKKLDYWIPDNSKESVTVSDSSDNISSEDLSRIKMKDVDVDSGVRRRSKGLSGYLDLLEIFYMDGLDKKNLLERLVQQKDYTNYVIEVHALKGVAATIGAMKLSEIAKEHEFAGKEGRTTFIHEDFDNLLHNYRTILTEVKRILTQEGRMNSEHSQVGQKGEMNPEQLTNEIAALLNEMQHFRPKEAAKKINQLLEYKLPENITEILTVCKTKLKLYEDDEVEDILGELLTARKEEQVNE